MALLDWIHRCNRFELTDFRPFLCAAAHIGWVHDSLITALKAERELFRITENSVTLNPALETAAVRSAALADLTDRWFADGTLPGWRGEHYRAATALDAPVLFSIERAAAPYFGLRAWGVHVNGFVRRPGGLHMWVARRAVDRPVAPGKWDHVVAGGLTADLTPAETLVKEAQEEAGLSAEIAASAVPVGHVSYCFTDPSHRMRPDTLLTYDLEMPEGLTPANTDGEVEEFALWPISDVLKAVRDTDTFKTNCNLVLIDFLIRHGFLSPSETDDFGAIAGGLRRPFPLAAG